MRVSALEIYTKMVEEGCIAERSLLEMWIFFFLIILGKCRFCPKLILSWKRERESIVEELLFEMCILINMEKRLMYTIYFIRLILLNEILELMCIVITSEICFQTISFELRVYNVAWRNFTKRKINIYIYIYVYRSINIPIINPM